MAVSSDRRVMTATIPGSSQPKIDEMLGALRAMAGQPDPAEEAGKAVLAFLKRCEGVRMPVMESNLLTVGQIGLVVHPDVYRWLTHYVLFNEKQEPRDG